MKSSYVLHVHFKSLFPSHLQMSCRLKQRPGLRTRKKLKVEKYTPAYRDKKHTADKSVMEGEELDQPFNLQQVKKPQKSSVIILCSK